MLSEMFSFTFCFLVERELILGQFLVMIQISKLKVKSFIFLVH